MKMEQWYEKIPQIATYNPNVNKFTSNIILSGKLSPLTNLFLNVFSNSIGTKNIIFAFPDVILRPIPIMSYIYASIRGKSVIVFTQKGNRASQATIHNKNYHLLNYVCQGGEYLFRKIPIGFMKDDSTEARVYLPRAKRKDKKEYIIDQKKNFLEGDCPKILLCYDEDNTRIISILKKITFDEGTFDNLNVNFEVGLLIFENVDRFVYSSYSLDVFLKWILPFLDRGVNILFHFSNPLSNYIKEIKERTNSYVLQFGPSLLKYNETLKKESLAYFKSIPREEGPFINKYNVDRPCFYTNITDLELLSPPLVSGNIDRYSESGKFLWNKINEEELRYKRQYYLLKDLLYKLPNLSINPSKYKCLFFDPELGYRQYAIPLIIEKIKECILDEQNFDNRVYLKRLISEIYALYSELKECKRYGEKDSYSRIAKDYQILRLLCENTKQNDYNSNIVLATYTQIEKKILNTEIEKLGFGNDFDIEYIANLSRKSFDRTNTILILPGPLRLRYISELIRPYRKIIMVLYDGKNYEFGKEQKNLIYVYSQQREDRAISYLKEIYTDYDLPIDEFLKDCYDMKSEPTNGEAKSKIEEPVKAEEDSIIVRIKKLLNVQKSKISKELLKEDEDEDHIEQKIAELEQEVDMHQMDKLNNYCNVTMERFDGRAKINRNLPLNKSYLYLKDINAEVIEGYPTDLRIGNYIVLIKGDERRTFLDTIIEIFDLEDSVNKQLLTTWREKLRDFMYKHDLSYKRCHELFTEKGGTVSYPEFLNWAKGEIIGPNDPNDLLALGKMMNEEEIIENYELIDQEVKNLRDLHRSTGRKIQKIIREVLKGELNQSELSFEESLLYDQISNNIYRIIDIKKVCDGEDGKNEDSSC